MSKTAATPELPRRRIARLAAEGLPAVVIAEIVGLPRLEVEAALNVDRELEELRRWYERCAKEPPEERARRLRGLTLAAIELALEEGDLRNLGWALRSFGIARPLHEPAREPGAARDPAGEADPLEEALAAFDASERTLWERIGYESWPVPPTVPPQPGAPRPRGPLEIENEAGTERERMAEPIPWAPPWRRHRSRAPEPAREEASAPAPDAPPPGPDPAPNTRPHTTSAELGALAADPVGPAQAAHGVGPSPGPGDLAADAAPVPCGPASGSRPADRSAGAPLAADDPSPAGGPLGDRPNPAVAPAGLVAGELPAAPEAERPSPTSRWPPHLRPV